SPQEFQFVSSHPPIPIGTETPAFGPVLCTASGIVDRVMVRDLKLRHSYDADLDLALESPAGTIVLLSDDNGENRDDYWVASLADGPLLDVRQGEAPFSGL